jgi:hypothetical protein
MGSAWSPGTLENLLKRSMLVRECAINFSMSL